MTFRFDRDQEEGPFERLMDPAYAAMPIGTVEQFESFISKIEEEINRYPSYGDFVPAGQRKRELKKLKKAIHSIRESLWSSGDNLQFLLTERAVFAYMFPDGPPDADKLDSELSKICTLIDMHLRFSLTRRERKIPQPVRLFAANLASEYYFLFGRLPDKANKKTQMLAVQNPFVNFLDEALHALVLEGYLTERKRPKDMKYLTGLALEDAKFEIDLRDSGAATAVRAGEHPRSVGTPVRHQIIREILTIQVRRNAPTEQTQHGGYHVGHRDRRSPG